MNITDLDINELREFLKPWKNTSWKGVLDLRSKKNMVNFLLYVCQLSKYKIKTKFKKGV